MRKREASEIMKSVESRKVRRTESTQKIKEVIICGGDNGRVGMSKEGEKEKKGKEE